MILCDSKEMWALQPHANHSVRLKIDSVELDRRQVKLNSNHTTTDSNPLKMQSFLRA
jgi:hypothetical protein